MNASARTRGFTLLEVLIAITLLALLIAMAFGTLRGAVATTHAGERVVTWTNQTRTVQEFLRRPRPDRRPCPRPVYGFCPHPARDLRMILARPTDAQTHSECRRGTRAAFCVDVAA